MRRRSYVRWWRSPSEVVRRARRWLSDCCDALYIRYAPYWFTRYVAHRAGRIERELRKSAGIDKREWAWYARRYKRGTLLPVEDLDGSHARMLREFDAEKGHPFPVYIEGEPSGEENTVH